MCVVCLDRLEVREKEREGEEEPQVLRGPEGVVGRARVRHGKGRRKVLDAAAYTSSQAPSLQLASPFHPPPHFFFFLGTVFGYPTAGVAGRPSSGLMIILPASLLSRTPLINSILVTLTLRSLTPLV